MTSPATPDDAIRRWSALFDNGETYGPRHSQREWAYITAGVRKADTMARFAAMASNPVHRGDARWCQAALNVYEALHAIVNDVDHGGNPQTRPACVGNGHIIRAWLSAPWTPPGRSKPTTNFQAKALFLLVEPEQRAAPFWLSTVVDLAQNLGVFGAPGRHISLRLADPPGRLGAEHVEVTVSRPGSPPLTSPPFSITDLAPTGRPPIDTVVGALELVTAVTNRLVDLRRFATANPHPTAKPGNDPRPDDAPTWGGRPPAGIRPLTADDEPEHRLGPGGRPYPTLNAVNRSTEPPAPPPQHPHATGRPSHR
jgi:hypothetical protein